jgi:hypothetical protein
VLAVIGDGDLGDEVPGRLREEEQPAMAGCGHACRDVDGETHPTPARELRLARVHAVVFERAGDAVWVSRTAP